MVSKEDLRWAFGPTLALIAFFLGWVFLNCVISSCESGLALVYFLTFVLSVFGLVIAGFIALKFPSWPRFKTKKSLIQLSAILVAVSMGVLLIVFTFPAFRGFIEPTFNLPFFAAFSVIFLILFSVGASFLIKSRRMK
jgi:archaellum biogenesis protein FlaJ (TadC family)